MKDYQRFIESKRLEAPAVGLDGPFDINPKLFPFQRDIVQWALSRGRAALFEECGLGKGWQALEWARIVSERTGGMVLVLAPVAVAEQFVREGKKLGVAVNRCFDGSQCSHDAINVTNYERLHKFDTDDFVAVVCDESSVIKSADGKTRDELIRRFANTPFKLACTATPSPNDYDELGNHAELLGAMSRTEMLSVFFAHDMETTQQWRLKPHARKDFWRWLSSWSVCLGAPGDIGYSNEGYDLPELHVHEHVVEASRESSAQAGLLFGWEASTLTEQRQARRLTIADRVARAAEIVARESDEQWLCWCDLNAESEALTKAIPGAVQITGSDSEEHKERSILDFIDGKIRVVVSKPSITGYGVNLQNCARQTFVGIGHSFEQYYQATRRIWRFGQTRPVHSHVIISSAEGRIRDNLIRKQKQFTDMRNGMVEYMADSIKANLGALTRTEDEYMPLVKMRLPRWIKSEVAA